jgi:hypothetical protein
MSNGKFVPALKNWNAGSRDLANLLIRSRQPLLGEPEIPIGTIGNPIRRCGRHSRGNGELADRTGQQAPIFEDLDNRPGPV